MCGIVASLSAYGTTTEAEARAKVDRGLLTLEKRGPDRRGSVTLPFETCVVTLGMSRLKIVDQSDIHVPFDFVASFGVVLAFNGEVYNWRTLRSELGEELPWRTRCDAEVVAASWWKWGPECLDHFNGMWGLVLADTKRNIVFAARDRAGEKPLYVGRSPNAVHFASEIKALPMSLEQKTCQDAEALEFDFRADTPFKNVEALEPGHYILLRDEDICVASSLWQVPRKKWWSLPGPGDLDVFTDRTEALVALGTTLKNAIKLRYVSEVPVAVQLSGGLDSAIVQAVAQSERLYCVNFSHDKVDNLSTARLAAGGREVTEVTFTRERMMRELPDIAYALDTPATWTAACQWFMNRKIAEDGNVVVLSGEGADELFYGYSRYRILWHIDNMLADPHLESYYPTIKRTAGGGKLTLLARMLWRSGREEDLVTCRRIIESYSQRWWSLVERMAYVDFYTTMQVLLRMADRMAAAFSLENRSPFFDVNVMEVAARIPIEWKIDSLRSKSILRELASSLGVDQSIVQEKTKKGLFVPSSWSLGGQEWDRSWFNREMKRAWSQAFFQQ